MKKMSIKAKLLAATVASGIVLSSVGVAFAGTESASKDVNVSSQKDASANKQIKGKNAEQKQRDIEASLKDAVDSKIITQDESDKVLQHLKNKKEEIKNKQQGTDQDKQQKKSRKNRENKGGLFKELVDEGILTQQKADSLKTKIYENKEVSREKNLNEKLSKLVEEKTITKEQSDKVMSAIKKSTDATKAEFEKVKDMTQEQRKEHMRNFKSQYKDPIKELVESKTITAEQEKAIREALFMNKNKKGFHKNFKDGHKKQTQDGE